MRKLIFTFFFFYMSLSFASFYPPGYGVDGSCREINYVKVCTTNHHYGAYPRFTVKYTGHLMEESWGNISVFVKFNGRSGTFKMKNQNYSEVFYIAMPESYLCHPKDSNNQDSDLTPPVGGYPWCERASYPGGGPIKWEIKPIPQKELDLIYYARDEYGRGNVWDIEVAFVSDLTGEWDSNLGDNFKFRFK